nr:hypothetical protein [Evansella caseinilytica]
MNEIKLFSLSPSIHEVALGVEHSSGSLRAKKNVAFMTAELMERVKSGRLDPMITEVLPWEKLPETESLQKRKGRHVRGKIIIRMQSEE